MRTTFFHVTTIGIFAGLGIAAFPFSAAAATCSFTRDLEFNMEGEDVRCLQQYLNSAGFTIATEGVGSPGRETNQLKDKTRDALIKWQRANNLSPAIGYFGPASRAKYLELVSGRDTSSAPGTSTSLQQTLQAELLKLQEQLQKAQGTAPSTVSSNDATVRKAITDAIASIKKAKDQIKKASGTALRRAEKNLADAEKDFSEAILEYFDGGKAASVITLAKRANERALEAYEGSGGKSTKASVEEVIDDVLDMIDEAWNEIKSAKSKKKDVSAAEDILKDAEKMIERAEKALDAKNYTSAEDLAYDAEDLVDEALDAIGQKDRRYIEDDIEDARDDLADAWDEVEEARDDGASRSVLRKAENLLNEAEELLDDAEAAVKKNRIDDAQDLVDEALELIEEALDIL